MDVCVKFPVIFQVFEVIAILLSSPKIRHFLHLKSVNKKCVLVIDVMFLLISPEVQSLSSSKLMWEMAFKILCKIMDVLELYDEKRLLTFFDENRKFSERIRNTLFGRKFPHL